MPDARPLVLLDIDGVLSPMSVTCPPTHEEIILDGDDLRLCDEHGRWLRSLQARCELAWAASMMHDANHVVSPRFGLGDLAVVELTGSSAPTWKLPDIQVFAGDRPVAWLDDEIGDDARAWAADRLAPTLLICCSATRGLSCHDQNTLESWLSQQGC